MLEQNTTAAGGLTAARDLQLSVRDREILEFERSRFKYAGAKDGVIRERWGLSSVRYFQIVNSLIDQPAALTYDAQLVGRLRRLRETRKTARTV